MARRAVVIGTGAGGLAAAAHLAGSGFEVTALEQAENPGGYLNPFFRGGYQFDPGLHYVGECRPGGLTYEALRALDLDAEACFCELDRDGFDVYRFPGLEVRSCLGREPYAERLAKLFPREERGLKRFFDVVEAIHEVRRAWQGAQLSGARLEHLRSLPRLPSVLRWSASSFGDLLRSYIGDPHLRSVLAAAGGDYGLPPSRASALVGAGLLGHYAGGAHFPRGGGAALRDALVASAERRGVNIRLKTRVERIVARDRVEAVELRGGERIETDVVISDADPVQTLGRLIDSRILPRSLRKKIEATEPSLATFGLYLGMKRDLRQHGLGRFNVWDYPAWDLDALYAPLFDGELPREPAFFLSPNSLKDDSGVCAPAGSSTLEIVTFVPYSRFERWRDRPMGDRGADYEREKREVGAWLLEAVQRRWPGVVGDVEVLEMSTPLTNESYTMAVRGAAYGPALTPQQSGFRRFATATPIANLFLAGAGVFGDGVGPCLFSGQVAARAAARAIH